MAAASQAATSRLAGEIVTSDVAVIPASMPTPRPSMAVLGAASPGTKLDRMLLLLEPSQAQQQALTLELENLQNPKSAEYHHWLTPAAFAAAYSNSASDVAAVAGWLQSQGFQVAALPAGREWIEFSGTAAQVEQAFHTQINSVVIAGQSRAVLAGEISVPAAIAPLVHGLVSLDGSLSTAAITVPQALAGSASQLAAVTSLNQAPALTPALLAPLLHWDALHASGTLGAGESIAIATRSNIHAGDVDAFRASFGLSSNAVQVSLNGTDPGLTADQAEATLAASWVGAVAPAAHILVVPAADTIATDGLDLSLAGIVDQALANTVVVGYSSCEASLAEAHQTFYADLYVRPRRRASQSSSLPAIVAPRLVTPRAAINLLPPDTP